MTREEAKKMLPFIQAFSEGRVIECRTKPSYVEGTDVPNDWTEMKEIEFCKNTEYRIKPEVKFRPFANAEECWEEMMKHQPFGWVKDSDGSKFTIETIASSDSSIFISDEGAFYLGEMFEKFKFADGTPFGVKEEE